MITPLEVKKSIGENLPKSFTDKWFLSLPILRVDDDRLYLAVFGTAVHLINADLKVMDRPSLWLIADIVDCSIEGIYACDVKDFSDAEYGQEYSARYTSRHTHLEEMIAQRNFLFDKWYSSYLLTGSLNKEVYNQYLEVLIKSTPDSYRRFFLELSNI